MSMYQQDRCYRARGALSNQKCPTKRKRREGSYGKDSKYNLAASLLVTLLFGNVLSHPCSFMSKQKEAMKKESHQQFHHLLQERQTHWSITLSVQVTATPIHQPFKGDSADKILLKYHSASLPVCPVCYLSTPGKWKWAQDWILRSWITNTLYMCFFFLFCLFLAPQWPKYQRGFDRIPAVLQRAPSQHINCCWSRRPDNQKQHHKCPHH